MCQWALRHAGCQLPHSGARPAQPQPRHAPLALAKPQPDAIPKKPDALTGPWPAGLAGHGPAHELNAAHEFHGAFGDEFTWHGQYARAFHQ